jgi:EF hand domain-containing protein
MFFLTGTAASSALDLIATLRQTLGAGGSDSAQPSAGTFDAGTAANATATNTPTDASAPTSLLAPSTLDALLAVQGQGQAPVVNGDAFSQQLFSLLDSNQDGGVSKSEFDTAFAQNGDTTQADQIFTQLDANGDGAISASELTQAIEGGSGSDEAPQVHHHHHHGMPPLAPSGTADNGSGSDGASDGLAALDGSSQTVTNSDGSTSTTITFADGSQVSMTLPAAAGSGTSGMMTNYIERMIERQAQMLAGSATGQSLAVSA